MFPNVARYLGRGRPTDSVAAGDAAARRGEGGGGAGRGLRGPGYLRISFARPLDELQDGARRIAAFLSQRATDGAQSSPARRAKSATPTCRGRRANPSPRCEPSRLEALELSAGHPGGPLPAVPKEKVWGLLVSLGAAGVVLRGIDLAAFDDWMRQEARGDEPYLGLSTVFYP